ncbi:MAG TPA: protein translocase subunit SecF [Patescibacteria group bacterium]|nr:protein translocase subunit SecF [Patescibacteria group bacterium]
MFKIIQKRFWWYLLSLLVLVPGIVSLGLWGLKLGNDFTGGSLIEYKLSKAVDLPAIEVVLQPLDLGKFTLVPLETDSVTIKLKTIDQETADKIHEAIVEKYPEAVVQSFESIGPTIGAELRQKAFTMTVLVLLGILLYVTFAFRSVGKNSPISSWTFGGATLVALLHDTLIVVGIVSILGHFFNFEVDTLFVTALLTVLGFSVHDTIVVFDRIRERLRISSEKSFELIVNESINQTLVRSINTSATVLIVLTALYLFGGHTLRDFIFVLIIGITAGTYSSIFVASPLLVTWERWKAKRA